MSRHPTCNQNFPSARRADGEDPNLVRTPAAVAGVVPPAPTGIIEEYTLHLLQFPRNVHHQQQGGGERREDTLRVLAVLDILDEAERIIDDTVESMTLLLDEENESTNHAMILLPEELQTRTRRGYSDEESSAEDRHDQEPRQRNVRPSQ